MSDETSKPEGASMDAEIKKAMAEAEAAVDAVKGTDEVEGEANDEALAGRVAELEGQLGAMRDKWLRAVADLENYKKRVKRDVDDAVQRSVSGLLQDFFPVADNLDRALMAMPDELGENATQLATGIKMVQKQFFASLGRHGITPIESVGKVFDPSMHDALQQMDSPDHAPGVIMQEFEKGYMRGDRLLRPARVVVAGAGSTGAPPPAADEGADSDDAPA